jgi:hypothetical protein
MTTTIPADRIMQTISYYYLVNYCPPSQVNGLKEAAAKLRKELADAAGMKTPAYFKSALPEVCWRITAFHQATRQADPVGVQMLVQTAAKADVSEKGAQVFQEAMNELAAHPARAKPDHRLHRQKGCRFCMAPCEYGYFTLVSDPAFQRLLMMLEAENTKSAGERDPVAVLWAYTTTHLQGVLGAKECFIRANHLGNLSYCLLMLATARSRFAMPERELLAFQALNQQAILRRQAAQAVGKGASASV